MKDLLRSSTLILGVLHLVGTKTNERMLFHSCEGLQFEKREAKIELRRNISASMFEDISLTLVDSFKSE